MITSTRAVSLWVFAHVLAPFFIVHECSSFSITQLSSICQRGSLHSPLFSSAVNGVDENIVKPSSDDGLLPSSLFESAFRASTPKAAETETGAHDAFRFEWGRWVDDEAVQELMEEINDVEIPQGSKIYDRLLELSTETLRLSGDSDESNVDEKNDNCIDNDENGGRRYRISGGDNWDCILHVLAKGTEWRGRWPTGSWAMVRALTGMVELNLMRGPDRDGFYKKATSTKLRGGGDGTLGGGAGGRGEDCVKYVGGALRSYSGVGGKTLILEVAIRPPMGKVGIDGDGFASLDIETFPGDDTIIAEILEENIELKKIPTDPDGDDSQQNEADDISQPVEPEKKESTTNLGEKMGLMFDKVGGLDDQLNDIVRRVLASR
jgi:hypothetical protein